MSWLRIQPLVISRWLYGVIFAGGALLILPPVFWEQHIHGGTFADAFWAANRQMVHSGPSAYNFVFAILFNLGLLWFTYFSKNKYVKDSDKFIVFLMLCGSGVGITISLVWYAFHI